MTKEPVTPCIHNTPARKIQLRDELYDIVYERTVERYNETLADIRDKNTVIMGYDWDGFTHRGVYYGRELEKLPHPNQRFQTADGKPLSAVESAAYRAKLHQRQLRLRNQKLDATLEPALDQLIAEREEVERVEGVMVRSALGTALNSAQAVSDYKRLLPSLLHPRLNEEESKCSCSAPALTDAQIDGLKARYDKYIGLIQKRQLIYLLNP